MEITSFLKRNIKPFVAGSLAALFAVRMYDAHDGADVKTSITCDASAVFSSILKDERGSPPAKKMSSFLLAEIDGPLAAGHIVEIQQTSGFQSVDGSSPSIPCWKISLK